MSSAVPVLYSVVSHLSEYAYYLAKDSYIVTDDDGIHVHVLRLKSYMILFSVKSLDGSLITDQCHDYIAVIGCGLLFYQDQISVQYSCLDHTVTLDSQHERSVILNIVYRQRESVLYIFDSQDGLSGCNFTNYRHIDQLFSGVII